MFKRKKKTDTFDSYLAGFIDGGLEAIDTLKVQKEVYGEIANINDMIALIEDAIETDLTNLLTHRD